MTTYTSKGFRPIKHGHEHIEYDRRGEPTMCHHVESAKEAAWLFANRLAKREYGKKGYCHHTRLDSASTDGRYGNYECFIGYRTEGGMTSGKNVHLSVYIEPQANPGNLAVWDTL